MGSVWRAEHLLLRSQVAIKLIGPEHSTTRELLGRFLREAQAAASLRSPHVVQILDYGVDEGTPYIAMELLEGESLGARLERTQRLAPAEVAALFVQIGRAVSKAHEAGIVHRDLKPDNVFIVRNDEDEIAKVLDFGIAKLSAHGIEAPATGATRTGALLGTPYYMSPEQLEGLPNLDHRSDIWALGVMAFECLVGQRPFDAETMGGLVLAICTKPLPVPSQLGAVPAGFDDWFARACSRELNQRFSSVREATRELKQLCGGSVVSGLLAIPEAPPEHEQEQEHEADAVTEIYRPEAHQVRRSLFSFSSSQNKPSKPRGVRNTAIAGVALLTVVTFLIWLRSPSAMERRTEALATPSLSTAPATVPRMEPSHAPPLSAPEPERTVVSLESIPTAAPDASVHVAPPTRPAATAPMPLRSAVAPAPIELEESRAAHDDSASLPENPYKSKKPAGPLPAAPADGF